MSDYTIQTQDLEGANTTLTMLVGALRALRAQGISPPVEEMVRGCVEDSDDPLYALARTGLLLSLAIQRLADQ